MPAYPGIDLIIALMSAYLMATEEQAAGLYTCFGKRRMVTKRLYARSLGEYSETIILECLEAHCCSDLCGSVRI